MMIESQEPTGAVAIRPCRAEECEAVLTLWRRAGAIPSPTDTLEELLRLVRSEHGDGFLVAVQEGAIPKLDTRVATLAWLGAVNEVVIQWLSCGEPDLLTEAAPALTPMLLRSIGVRT